MSSPIAVPIVRITIRKVTNINLPDGTPVMLSVRQAHNESHKVPRDPEFRLLPSAPLKNREVHFSPDVLVYIPAIFPRDDTVRIMLRDPRDRSLVYSSVRSSMRAIVEKSQVTIHGNMEMHVPEKLQPKIGDKMVVSLDFFTCRNPAAMGIPVTPESEVERYLTSRPIPGNELSIDDYADMFSLRQLMTPYLTSLRQAGMAQIRRNPAGGQKRQPPSSSVVVPGAGGSSSTAQEGNKETSGAGGDEEFRSLTETATGRKAVDVSDKVDSGNLDARPKKSVTVPWEDAPLLFNPSVDLMFECNRCLAPLNKELIQVVTVQNRTDSNINCSIARPRIELPRFSFTMDAHKFVLGPKEKTQITFKLTLFCTMDMELKIPVHMWERGAEYYFTSDLLGSICAEPSTHLDPNEVITGKEIGHGAFGDVYSGIYRGIDAAVKVIKLPGGKRTPEIEFAFEREVKNQERLRHPAIVHFIGSINIGPILAILTEMCPFGSLQKTLEVRKELSTLFRLKALLDLSNAMDYLHCNHFIHRDLKTENALVCSLDVGEDPTSMSPIVKLADFGTTRGLGSLSGSEESMLLSSDVGTPIFMAPEVLRHSSAYTNSVDVFSFGILMAHVLSGFTPYLKPKRLFSSRSDFENRVILGTLRPEFPERASSFMRRVMQSCWNNDPQARPSFRQVSEALKQEISDVVSKNS